MGVRDRLEGKARRSTTFEVQVEDASPHQAALYRAEQLLLLAQADDLRAKLDAPSQRASDAEAARDGAIARVRQCFEVLTFRALEPQEFEQLAHQHVAADGELDADAFRPVLAAVCVTDSDVHADVDDVLTQLASPDEHDEPTAVAWWREQLESGTWSLGEREALYGQLWRLNYTAPGSGLGKG